MSEHALDGVVMTVDLIGEAHVPGRRRRLDLVRAELTLHPRVEVVDTVRVHADHVGFSRAIARCGFRPS